MGADDGSGMLGAGGVRRSTAVATYAAANDLFCVLGGGRRPTRQATAFGGQNNAVQKELFGSSGGKKKKKRSR